MDESIARIKMGQYEGMKVERTEVLDDIFMLKIFQQFNFPFQSTEHTLLPFLIGG